MKTRKLWAPRGWLHPEAFSVFKHGRGDVNLVEVDVSEVDPSRPDFEPGDPVQWKDLKVGYEVYADPWPSPQGWMVPLARRGVYHISTPAKYLTKLPRETSVLLRVTGPEDWVEDTVRGLDMPSGVRVERVEEAPDDR